MKVVLDILRFREDFIPSEDRYEYSLVVALGGELTEIAVTEEQLQTALREYAELVGQVEEGGHLQAHPHGGMSVEPAPKLHVEDEELPLRFGIYVEGGVLYKDGEVIPLNAILSTPEGKVTVKQFLLSRGYELGYAPEEGAVMEPPQVFRSPEEVQNYVAETQEGLEEPLEFDTSEGEEVDEIAAALLGEDAGRPTVDEVVVGGPPAQSLEAPEQDMTAVFGDIQLQEEQPAVKRRDMTPPSTARVQKIKNRIKQRNLPNAHQKKLADMRARAKRHPMRAGPGADEAGNPLVAPRPRPSIPQAPAHVPGKPTVKHVAPPEPTVEDEDGFPSA